MQRLEGSRQDEFTTRFIKGIRGALRARTTNIEGFMPAFLSPPGL